MKKKSKVLILVAALLVLLLMSSLIGWIIWGNVTVGLTCITVSEKNLPQAFDGFRIAQVSDLHNSFLWEAAIQRLQEAQPDIIVITGDLVDSYQPDVDVAMQFIAQAVQIADCFYISGNHEARLPQEIYQDLVSRMQQFGVMVLEDSKVRIHRDGAYICLAGHSWGQTDQLEQLADFDGYRILLSHQPEDFANYKGAGFDLVFSGHAHGGQIRLPLLGGLYAPGQGVFPQYDAGLYSDGDTDMIVSRGVGNSAFPIRLNNRPEVVLVILESEVG